MQHSVLVKVVAAQVIATSLATLVAVAATRHRRRKPQLANVMDPNLIPRLDKTESGRVERFESFSQYVARQMGFDDPNECPQLCKLAMDYLKKSKGSEDRIFEYFEGEEADAVNSLYVKLVKELERCVLAYYAFHWEHAPTLIKQVVSTESDPKLKDLVMAATRHQRFQKVTKDLKMTSVLSILVSEMRAINRPEDEVMVPLAHDERSPVLLFMGGGMGAGKSTILKEIRKEPFWAEASKNAVVVEADAFKEMDIIYKALNSTGRHNDMLHTAELVHQSSTDAASSLLVTALNEGRDVIMDGTLSWEPFVQQTIDMARNVHKRRYRMGVGYKVNEDGTVMENYWEPVTEEEDRKIDHDNEENAVKANRKPYRIELVGVVCDAYVAVVRAIRRAIIMGRAVRVSSQLTSHRRFAKAFPGYCNLVDNARLYCTNAIGGPPTLIARKDGESKLLVDMDEIKCLNTVSDLNPHAESVDDLYSNPDIIYKPGSVWKEEVLSPSRESIQLELKSVIKKIEGEKNKTMKL